MKSVLVILLIAMGTVPMVAQGRVVSEPAKSTSLDNSIIRSVKVENVEFDLNERPFVFSLTDEIRYNAYLEWIEQYKKEPLNKLVLITAKFFLNNSYASSSLEDKGEDEEKLTINFREFDCTTFIETCISLARTVKSMDTSIENYAEHLKLLRYRDGIISGYPSRLHYMSDWVYDGERKNIMKDVSLRLKGAPEKKEINYMSIHYTKYPGLKNNENNRKLIKLQEEEISRRNHYYIIPISGIPPIERALADGDIVLFATRESGLDYFHMGIVSKTLKGVQFIHASSVARKIITEDETLYRYAYLSKACSGISVIRVGE